MLGVTADHTGFTAALIQLRNALWAQYAADSAKQCNDDQFFPTVKLLTPMLMANAFVRFLDPVSKVL
ncbi:unnamed protein product [Tilletia controversa]|nr:unnamed protein product [Tilletia controversa]CAD6964142.1 unnamed protein product [Tilletia controversa]